MAIGINKAVWERVGQKAGWLKTTTPVKTAQDARAQIAQNQENFYSTSQDTNPDGDNFAVDIRRNSISIPSSARAKATNALAALGDFHDRIPMSEIIDILKGNGIIIIQEDGTHWEGFVMPTGDAGATDDSGKPKNAPFYFDLAFKHPTLGKYLPCNNRLSMSAVKMPSGKIEVVTYIT